MKENARFIAGYILGFSVFILLIPFGLYKLTHFDYLFSDKVLFSSDVMRFVISGLFFIVGAVFAIWSNIFLFEVGKGGPVDAFGVSISPQTKKLVTTGPYKYSRNPMGFGAFTLYLSVALFLNSILAAICILTFLAVMIIYLKFSEEKRLVKDFGEEYIEYRKNVSIVFPVKKMRKKYK